MYKQIIYLFLVIITVFGFGNSGLATQSDSAQQKNDNKLPIRYTNAMVEAEFIPDTIMIGDQPILRVTITKDIADMVGYPDFSEKMELYPGVELLSEGAIDTVKVDDGRRIKMTRDYKITVFELEQFKLRFPVLVGNIRGVDTLMSDEKTLWVKSYAIDTLTQKIYDVKAPLAAPLQFSEIATYVYIGLGILALIILAIWLIRRYRKHKSLFARTKLPPHVVAVNELLKIKEQNLWQNGLYKEYYTDLTDTLREYIDARFGYGAMEMTTSEIMTAIENDNIENRNKEALRDLLLLSDMVKFAKMSPDDEDNVKAIETAFAFVDSTKKEDAPLDVEMVDPDSLEKENNQSEDTLSDSNVENKKGEEVEHEKK